MVEEGVKTMKGRVIKKLKSSSTITSLKQSLLLRTTNGNLFQTNESSDKDEDQDQQQQQSSSSSEESKTTTTNHHHHHHPDPVESPNPGPPENLCKNTEEKESEEQSALWREFEEKCPPGGNESVVFYTTSMRGIRKTFEDCSSIRFLLESFRVEYRERDVSLHMEYRDELWKIMGKRAVPPRLFIRGRYIGGADEVVGLHERGMLKKLLRGISLSQSSCSCKGCAGVRFVLCFACSGSRKIVAACREGRGRDESVARCSDCNENGLVMCPMCNLDK